MGSKIKDNKMIAPKEVRYEIGEKNDALKKWIGEYPSMFVRDVGELKDLVAKISQDFPNVASKKKPHRADLWIIALARLKNKESLDEATIVTQENAKGGQNKIPIMAAKYNIKCIGILDMFRLEKWTF